MRKAILQADGLCKHYPGGFMLTVPRLAFDGGRIHAITGPNGSGKTTLLLLLALLETPDKGTISFRGKEVRGRQAAAARLSIGMVSEDPYFYRGSVLSNVALGPGLRSRDRDANQRAAEDALDAVGLLHLAGRQASSLSRGEGRRTSIARALAAQPAVLMLDEPFANADTASCTIIEKLLRTVAQESGTSIILTSHDGDRARAISDKLISLVDGNVVAHALENVFAGETEGDPGSTLVRLAGGVKVAVVTSRTGRVHISIPSTDIILSRRRLDSSARNSFQGIVRQLQAEGTTVKASVDTGVEFKALITKASLEEMRLSVGSEVFVTFKTTSVRVF